MELIFVALGVVLLFAWLSSKRHAKHQLHTFTAMVAVVAMLGCSLDLYAVSGQVKKKHKRNGQGSTEQVQVDASTKGRGLCAATPEAIADVETNWPTIVDVQHNKVGLERIQHHRKSQGIEPLAATPVVHTEEFTVVKGKYGQAATEFSATNAGSTTLPPSVDNSQLPSFPPIGDQGQIGSCVAWGTTYYQATHEYGLLNGLNNKTSFTHVFSPKWTYNNLNGGGDNGLDIFSTYNLLSQNGLVSIVNFPYDTNYLAWDLNAQDWVNAANYRFQPGQLVSGIGGASQNLAVIKTLLNNGHVLVFGTYVDSWVTDTVKADPSAPSNPHAGELAAVWMNGMNGGHCMTIVGYDDNVWIDVNGNGKVDPGEKGAFLIANSWSSNWGNKGFVWVSYDAFLSHSAVASGPSRNRVALGDAMNSNVVTVVPLAHNYAPTLVAQSSLSQAIRDQISITVGVSDTTSTSPTKTFNSYALVNQGGNLEFNGTTPGSNETATFAIDLSDLVPTTAGQQQRYYLIVKDSSTGHPTTVNSFQLLDTAHNITTTCSTAPVSCDKAQATLYIDYAIGGNPTPPAPTPPAPTPPAPTPPAPTPPAPTPPAPTPPAPTPPAPTPPAPTPPAPTPQTLVITSPVNNQNVYGMVWVTGSAKNKAGIAGVDFYVDGVYCGTDTTPPYQGLLDTLGMSKGKHTITLVAHGNDGQTTTQTVSIYVRNIWGR